jgi:rare lipoprotein A
MRRILLTPLLVLAALAALSGCASTRSARQGVAVERGIASWYGPGFHGRHTASGEPYDMAAMTAAHRSLPFGTVVDVRNLANGLAVRVKINDRGPFVGNRIIDLSRAAADAIGLVGPGTALVELVAVGVEPIGGFAFTVQVGAFREVGRARDLADRLRDDFPEVEVRSDAVWSRVQVGSFASRFEAQRLAAELAARGFPAVVVPLALVDAELALAWRLAANGAPPPTSGS